MQKQLTRDVRQALRPVAFMTDTELAAVPTGDLWVFDVETYRNFWYVAFKHLKSGKFVAFEQSPAHTLDCNKLRWMLWRFCIVGFNSRNYDIPMITLALTGASCEALKEASDFIIMGNNLPFHFEKEYKIKIDKFNHIDLIEVAPLQGSLKLYAGRLHCERMQDLPFPPSHILTEDDAEVVRPYCCNDLSNTELLFNELAQEIKLRNEMSSEYGIDLRSKSDAQVAEAVINSELQKVLGYYPKKPTISPDTILEYSVPAFVGYSTKPLQDMLEVIRAVRFELDGIGSPVMPKSLEKLKVKIGKTVYKLGMGGLHSTEKCVEYVASDDIIISDNDVESYYPRIILNQSLCPPGLGEAFLTVYEGIVLRRLAAKKAKNKRTSDTLKIVINGSFGKLGNKYSTLYAPQLMLQVTITGQLALLMLIEMLDAAGIDVVSGNTDGVVSVYHKSRHDEVRAIVALWETRTAFKTEETRYARISSRDVNSYIAVKIEGGDPAARYVDEQLGCKTKGTYCERGSALNSLLSKNPEANVCSDAVLAFLVNETPVEETIANCKDFRRFVSVRNVKGGGEKNGEYLGKVVRWYYPKHEAGHIAYVMSGNKVAKTDGARPVMDLPAVFPTDIDYAWYIKEATEMLYDCGRFKKAKTGVLFF